MLHSQEIKSRIFKDALTFTADAIEILQDDGAIPSKQSGIQREAYSDQDNDKGIQVKIGAKDKGKRKMYKESDLEHIEEDAIGCTLKDSDSFDDGKPISEIFKGKNKNCFVVQSNYSKNDSSGYALESAQKVINKKTKRKLVGKREGIVHFDLTQDPANDDNWFSEDEDSFDHSEQILDDVDIAGNFNDADSDMPLSDTLNHMEHNLIAGTPKKITTAQAKIKQVTKALSTMKKKKKKSYIS